MDSVPSATKDLLDVLDLLDRIARLPDDVALTTEEAALYLRVSTTTLERMRSDGSGPEYCQGGRKSTRGANLKVTYSMKSLRSWRAKNSVSSTMEAAVRRGMAFGSVRDSLVRIPFWHHQGNLVGRVFDDTPGEYLEHRKQLGICWMSSATAVTQAWHSQGAKLKLVDAYKKVLETELKSLDSAS